jgi:hypothetical protein
MAILLGAQHAMPVRVPLGKRMSRQRTISVL